MENQNLYKLLEPHTSLGYKYFTFLYKKLPNARNFKLKIDIEKLKEVLTQRFPETDLYFISNENLDSERNGIISISEENNLNVILREGLILQYFRGYISFYFDERTNREEIHSLHREIVQAGVKSSEGQFFMIKKCPYEGFELVDFKIKQISVNLNTNYNDDLFSMHEKLISHIYQVDSNGVILFNGMPGTGKTSYIRHIIHSCAKRFIYIPNNLFVHLMDPEFIAFICKFPESVIILEDCEELLRSRLSQKSESGLSNLLNLGDGLLGDALKLKMICTFNCKLSKVDEALVRKGRLSFHYEFGPLTVEKSNNLLQLLGYEERTNEPLTLAEIYNFNQEESSHASTQNNIGF